MTLWGGRFSTQLNDQAWDLNSSLPIDKRMAIQDVAGSLAWGNAIRRAGILTEKEHASISLGLATIREEFSAGRFSFAASDEDIHTAVERRLTELIGPFMENGERLRSVALALLIRRELGSQSDLPSLPNGLFARTG